MSKEHEHNFVAEKYQVQEYVHEYASGGKYDTAILSHQRVMLFCTKCGETRSVSVDEDDKSV